MDSITFIVGRSLNHAKDMQKLAEDSERFWKRQSALWEKHSQDAWKAFGDSTEE